jgi:serine/threonine-protein kinase
LLFHDKQNFYLVHEMIEGKTLYEEYLLEGGFTEIQMCTFVKQIIQYLSVIHQHGLFHSDIKPSNILITKPPMVIPSQTIINAGGQ